METGVELAGDLAALWRLGSATLPEIGDRWAGANQEMNGHAADTGSFSRSTSVAYPYGGSGNTQSVGRVYPHFDALRDALQNVMAESANNMYDAATAIITIMNNYAHEDTVAGDELNKLADGNAHALDDLVKRRPEVHKAQ